jgi:methylthioribose-1-phosphate isomerase
MCSTTASPEFETLRWVGNAPKGHLELLDQTQLPVSLEMIACRDVDTVWQAIRKLQVRGAPAIGIAAAYGVCIGLQQAPNNDAGAFQAQLDQTVDYLATSRPTAVNLFWALDRMRALGKRLIQATESNCSDFAGWHEVMLNEACSIHTEDRQMCHNIGTHAAKLLAGGGGVLTHCNAGGLATSELGTALAGIVTAHRQGVKLHAYVDETRPLLQGARLTAWELQRYGVPMTLICDSMAAQVMKEGRIQAVITGADRIAANGDAANKIGTYGLAVLARAHGIPFYIAAPSSTFDLSLENGQQIPIEEREATEIVTFAGTSVAPAGTPVYNPAFDVTPIELISAIITEKGIWKPGQPI